MSIEAIVKNTPTIYGTWTPVLKGATQDPSAVTYSVQKGRYELVGNVCHFWITIVTTSITKTTLTDQIRVSLPYIAYNEAGMNVRCDAIGINSTPVQVANCGKIAPNTQYVSLSQILAAAAEKAITYASTDPGIGVLTNTITIEISGSYKAIDRQ